MTSVLASLLTWKALAILVSLFALDFLWTTWTRSITEKRPLLAGFCSAFIYLVSGLTTVEYVSQPILLVPAVVGAWFGSYLSVLWSMRRD